MKCQLVSSEWSRLILFCSVRRHTPSVRQRCLSDRDLTIVSLCLPQGEGGGGVGGGGGVLCPDRTDGGWSAHQQALSAAVGRQQTVKCRQCTELVTCTSLGGFLCVCGTQQAERR